MSGNKVDVEILKDIGRIANADLHIDERLKAIISVIIDRTGSDASSILLLNPHDNTLLFKATQGLNPDLVNKMRIPLEKGIVGYVVRNKEVVALPVAAADPRFEPVPGIGEERYKSALAVPILHEGLAIGVIYNQTIEEKTYTKSEIEFLEAIAEQVVGIIRNSQLRKELEQVSSERATKIKELALLHEIGVAIQTVPDFNTLIRLILGCITVGDGLGFNRAMLFLFSDETNMLEGTMGLGPDSMEEAADIWRTMPKIENLVKWLLTHDYKDQGTGTNLNNFVRSVRVPVDSSGGILAMSLIKGKSFNLPDASQNPYVDRDFIEKVGTNSFAVVPIIVREQYIGVILVDNRYTGKEITEGDIEYLVHFTSYIGLAIHNRRLFKKLRESHNDILVIQNKLLRSEKLSALGELTAELVHELKNPLMVIGGLTRRIVSNPNLDPDKYDRYNRAIQDEVSRIEKLLKEIQTNSRLVSTELAETDINMLIEDIIFFYEHTSRDRMVNIVKELSADVGRCLVDPDRFKQVIINLVHNSMDAMPGGGTLTIKTESVKDDYNNGIMLTVTDTGTGIPPNVIDRIFDPFFTTKDDGTGLGLAMSKKIVEAHGGTIEYKGRPGGGAIFSIYIPRVGEGSMLVQANISSKKVRHH